MFALAEFDHLAEEFKCSKGLYRDCISTSQLKVGSNNANATLGEVRRQLPATSCIQFAVISGLTLGNMARAHEKLSVMTRCSKLLLSASSA